MKEKSKRKNLFQEIKNRCVYVLNQYFISDKKHYRIPIIFLSLFYFTAILMFILTGKVFYLFNFIYIGTALALGIFMTTSLKKPYVLWGRRITQILIGVYMFVFIGIGLKENIQIEGFFFYLLSGVFSGAVLHYVIAKIVGPFVFSRGWCGWACWTTMILDLLPYRMTPSGRNKQMNVLRYLLFFITLIVTLFIWFTVRNLPYDQVMVIYFITGNVIYYLVGIIMAVIMKDNRAFCKYACPIAVLMKITSRFSLIKVAISRRRCNECGICEQKCPMNIKITDYKKLHKRILSTECILCNTCIDSCPQNALSMNIKYDYSFQEYLRYSEKSGKFIKVIKRKKKFLFAKLKKWMNLK